MSRERIRKLADEEESPQISKSGRKGLGKKAVMFTGAAGATFFLAGAPAQADSVDCSKIPRNPGCVGMLFKPSNDIVPRGAMYNPALVTPDNGIDNKDVKTCQTLNFANYPNHIGDGFVYRMKPRGAIGKRTLSTSFGLADMQKNDGKMDEGGLLYELSCAAAVDTEASIALVKKVKGKTKVVKVLRDHLRLPREKTGFRSTGYLNRMFGLTSSFTFSDAGLRPTDLVRKNIKTTLSSPLTSAHWLRVKVTSKPRVNIPRHNLLSLYPDKDESDLQEYPDRVVPRSFTRDYRIAKPAARRR